MPSSAAVVQNSFLSECPPTSVRIALVVREHDGAAERRIALADARVLRGEGSGRLGQ